MFGHESKPCMVYEYGCLTPIDGEEEMFAETKRRNDFWNKLVEIEKNYRERVKEILTVPDNPVLALRDERTRLRAEIKSRRKTERSGQVNISDLKDRIKEINKTLSLFSEEDRRKAKETRKKVIEANRHQLKEIDSERKSAVKQAQHGSGLYWCNSNDVIASYDTARKRAMKEGTELKFHRWTGEGKAFVRYQYGLPVQDVFGNDTRLQIDPVNSDAWDHPVRSVRRKAARTKVRLRVTSENRNPVWVELPMVMHRPLPAESEIRSAAVIREQVGRKYRYKLVVTVTVNRTKIRHDGDVVGIDIGWRLIENYEPEATAVFKSLCKPAGPGLRVAYWNDGEKSGQLVLPPRILAAFNKLKDLKSIRDTHFNEVKETLSAWLVNKDIPDWLVETTKFLASWRSQGRIVQLTKTWRKNRFNGDEDIVETLEHWLSRENHLYDWEANLRDQVQRWRREGYRKFAAQIACKYKRVVMEDFDLRRVSKKPEAEEGTLGSRPQDWQRVIAAVSELRLAIENACRREGTEFIQVESQQSTTECHKCGHVERFDAANHLYHTCSNCGNLHDQDYNASIVLRKRAVKLLASAMGI